MADLLSAVRVFERSNDTGDSPFNLSGVTPNEKGVQTFVDAGMDGKEVFIMEAHSSANQWQISRALITDGSPDTYTILAVMASSNSGAQVDWANGFRDVFAFDWYGFGDGPLTTIETNVILDESHYQIEANSTSALTATLPSVSTYSGKKYVLKTINTGGLSIQEDAADSNTIEDHYGESVNAIALDVPGEFVILRSDGTKWRMVATSKTPDYTYVFNPDVAAATIQSLIENSADGSTFFFKDGTYSFTTAINITGIGKRIVGQSMDDTIIENGAGVTGSHVFELTGSDHTIENIRIQTALEISAGTGRIFNVSVDAGISNFKLERVQIFQNRSNNGIFENALGEVTRFSARNCYFRHTTGSTVPAWLFTDNRVTDSRKIVHVSFENCRMLRCGKYAFKINSSGTTSAAAGIQFRNMQMEDCAYGMFHFIGTKSCVVEHVWQGNYTRNIAAHLIRIEGGADVPDPYVHLRNILLGDSSATYDSGIKDIWLNSSVNDPPRVNVLLENIHAATSGEPAIKADFNACRGVVEINSPNIGDRSNDAHVVRFTHNGYHNFNCVSGIRVQDNRNDEANKSGHVVTEHWTQSAEEDVLGFQMNVFENTASMNVGGGSGLYNATTEVAFYAAANNRTLTGTKLMTLTTSAIQVFSLPVYFTGSFLALQSNRTDNTNKNGHLTTVHYDTEEEQMLCMQSNVFSGTGSLNFGGGSGSYNAFTEVAFYAAANNTTLTGTKYLSITATRSQFDNNLQMGADALILRDVNAGITASVTQTQGQGALTAQVNEVATVANPNDTVTLPSAAAGLDVTVINNGANTLQIFPASGDNAGGGVDTAVTLAAGVTVTYSAYDATNWESVTGGMSVGSTVTGGTAGSILFVDASGNLGQDNSGLYYDDSANELGVGTTSPDAAIHVVTPNYPSTVFERTSTVASSTGLTTLRLQATTSLNMGDGFGGYFEFAIEDSAGVVNPVVQFGGIRNGADNSGALVIDTYSGGTASERVRVISSGYVGVNETSPGAQIQVNTSGTGVIGAIVKATAGQTANLQEWQDSSGTVLAHVDASGQIRAPEVQFESANDYIDISSGNLRIRPNQHILVSPGGTERFRFESSGDFLVGNTDIVSWSGYKAIQVGPESAFLGSDSTDWLQLASNCYYDGTWKYRTTGEASNFYTGAGTHGFRVATSGSADTAITWAEAFYINAAANVGVGRTDPGVPFDVSGNVNFTGTEVSMQTNETNSTNKNAHLVSKHWNTAEQDMLMFQANNFTSTASLNFGGGSGAYNCYTEVAFYAAANNTTLTGTKQFSIVEGRLTFSPGGVDAEKLVAGTATTTDATVTTLDTFATSSNTAYHVEATVVGAQTSDYSEVASYKLHGTFKNDGGVLSLVGSVTADHTGEDTAGWDATLDASGTDIRIRVTGAAATTINWKGSMKVMEVS